MHITYPHFVRRNLKLVALGATCIGASFVIGIHTAGNVLPIELIEAGGTELSGDVDGNGAVDLHDVVEILEVAAGYKTPTMDGLKADPNRDGIFSIDDALAILDTLVLR